MNYDSDDLFETKNRPPKKKLKSKAKRRVKPVAPVQPPLIGITFWTCNICTHEDNEVTNLSRTRQKCAMCDNDRSMSDDHFEPTAKKPPANTTKRQLIKSQFQRVLHVPAEHYFTKGVIIVDFKC